MCVRPDVVLGDFTMMLDPSLVRVILDCDSPSLQRLLVSCGYDVAIRISAGGQHNPLSVDAHGLMNVARARAEVTKTNLRSAEPELFGPYCPDPLNPGAPCGSFSSTCHYPCHPASCLRLGLP